MSGNRPHTPEVSADGAVERVCLIMNPKAGAGSAKRGLDGLRRTADRVLSNWELRLTEGPSHAEELAEEAGRDGFDVVAAVGGDGTCNEVVNGLMRLPRNRRPTLAVVPFGTGSDLIKSLCIKDNVNKALWVASTGITLPTDVGHARFRAHGVDAERYFLNVAGFGANGAVAERANSLDKRWGGRLTFLRASLHVNRHYEPVEVDLGWAGPSGEASWSGRLLACFVANGAYCGGGMWVGRGGTMHDGVADLTVLPATSQFKQLLDARHLYDGNLHRAGGAQRVRVQTVSVQPRAAEPICIDLDGEMVGELPLTISLHPRALSVRGGWTRSPLIGSP